MLSARFDSNRVRIKGCNQTNVEEHISNSLFYPTSHAWVAFSGLCLEVPSWGPRRSPTSSLLRLQTPRFPLLTADSRTSKSGGTDSTPSPARYIEVWNDGWKGEGATGEAASPDRPGEGRSLAVANGSGSASDTPSSSRSSEAKREKSSPSPERE